jgi:hypothetical protein
MSSEETMVVGVQPLDEIMQERGLKNHDLVTAAPPGFINHKQIQKARKGRRLTPRMQEKVLEALNAALDSDDAFSFEEIFNYRGKKELKQG